MGYNGGTNKRGYYRRFHGMQSKSSYKSGEKILSNTILGGLGLIAAAGSAIANAADDLPTNFDTMPSHFDPRKQRRQYIIWGIVAILFPIGGFLTFEFAGWWMFFSVLLFGFFETAIVTAIFHPADSEQRNKNYIYEDEVDDVRKYCRTNRKILITLYISLFVLNLYPLALLAVDCIEVFNNIYLPIYGWDGGETSIPLILILLKLFINGMFIVEIFQNKIVVENYKNIHKRTTTSNSTCQTIETPQVIKENESSQAISDIETNTLHINEDIKLPKISGHYSEKFWTHYGTLYIYSTYANISFIFPGPDQRYKSTYFTIPENEIDKYIVAYEKNWQIAEKLLEQTKNLPNIELKQKGEMGMDIVVRNSYVSIYLYYYHLPLNSKKECDEMIQALKKAKTRIKQVREKLFAED